MTCCRRSSVDRVRADARRNRELLLDAAVRAFANDGADVTLDAIAKSAGVGIGTLYRHFPTRDALVEAAYRQELAHLCDAVPGLLRSLPPDEATRHLDGWLHRLHDDQALHGRGASSRHRLRRGTPTPRGRGRLIAAIHRAARRRCHRRDPEVGLSRPNDVLLALSGVSLAAGEPAQRQQAGRLLDLLVDGLRHRAAAFGPLATST